MVESQVLLGIFIVVAATYIETEAVPGECIVLPFWLSSLFLLICYLASKRIPRSPLGVYQRNIWDLNRWGILGLVMLGVFPALSPLSLH